MSKKIIRLTESDLTRLVRKVIQEQSFNETDPKKTDCKTNPYWKQLESKILSLGFTKKEKHLKFDGREIYPNVDFTQCTMSHSSGIKVIYPFDMLDYTGDYHPEFVKIYGIPEQKMFKNASCVGTPPNEPFPQLNKVKCVDYIYQLISSSINK